MIARKWNLHHDLLLLQSLSISLLWGFFILLQTDIALAATPLVQYKAKLPELLLANPGQKIYGTGTSQAGAARLPTLNIGQHSLINERLHSYIPPMQKSMSVKAYAQLPTLPKSIRLKQLAPRRQHPVLAPHATPPVVLAKANLPSLEHYAKHQALAILPPMPASQTSVSSSLHPNKYATLKATATLPTIPQFKQPNTSQSQAAKILTQQPSANLIATAHIPHLPKVANMPASFYQAELPTLPKSAPTARVISKMRPQHKVRTASGTNRDLNRYIRRALTTNPEILAERANWLRDKQLARQARGALFPAVDVSVGVGRESTHNPTLTAINVPRRRLTRRQAILGVNQLLFDGGNTLGRYRSAKQSIKASHYRVNQVKQTIVLGVIQAYVDVVRFTELKLLALKNALQS